MVINAGVTMYYFAQLAAAIFFITVLGGARCAPNNSTVLPRHIDNPTHIQPEPLLNPPDEHPQPLPQNASPFIRHNNAGGGHCFFYTVADMINQRDGTQLTQQDIRNQIANAIVSNDPQTTLFNYLAVRNNLEQGQQGGIYKDFLNRDQGWLALLGEFTVEDRELQDYLLNNPNDPLAVLIQQRLADRIEELNDQLRKLITGGPQLPVFWGDDLTFGIAQEQFNTNLIFVRSFDENNAAQFYLYPQAPQAKRYIGFIWYSHRGHYQVLGAKHADKELYIFDRHQLASYPEAVQQLIGQTDKTFGMVYTAPSP